MTLTALKTHFRISLATLFSAEEIEEIFYLLLSENENLSRLEFVIKRAQGVKNADVWHRQLNRLMTGEPVQYILNRAHFWEMNLIVNSNVLIPRPETEELVHLIIKDLNHSEKFEILDIGTGSGCIALALKKELPNARVQGLDVSSAAIEVAIENATEQKLEKEWITEDIASYETSKKYDIIVSNPPYIPVSDKTEMANNVLDFEPHLALFAPDNDPLFFYKKIGDFAANH